MTTENPLPPAALAHAIAIVGRTGSGKTFAAKSAVESMLKAGARVCIVDPTGVWWGLRKRADGGDGFPIVIFGGEHADVPITDGAGSILGELVATGKVHSAIIDVSEFTGGETTRFLTAFFETLYARANRAPLHLVMDEADVYAPQQPLPDQRRMQGAVNKIVRRGRVKGFRPIMITQRPAVLDKSVLSQVSTLVAMRLTSPQDRKAIDDWVKGNADIGQARAVLESLPGLAIGEGWIWSPADDVLERATFPPIVTFDSSRAPEHGEDVPPAPSLSEIDVAELQKLMQPVETQEAAEGQCGSGGGNTRADLDSAVKRAREAGYREGYEAGLIEGEKRGKTAGIALGLTRARNALDALRVPDIADASPALASKRTGTSAAKTEASPAAQPKPDMEQKRQPTGNGALPSSARKMLAVLDTDPPVRRTWPQTATLAGLKARGGHYNTGRKALLDGGLVIEEDGLIRVAAPSASATAPVHDPAALVEMWASVLSGAAPRILRLLHQHGGESTRERVAAALGLAPRGGHWNAAWKALRDNGIIAESGSLIRLTELFRQGSVDA